MKRTLVAICLAVAALALLASLVLKSRSVPIEVHLAHHTAVSELDRVGGDFAASVATLQSAWETSRNPGEGARNLAARVAASPDRVSEQLLSVPGGTSQRNRVRNSLEGFARTVDQAGTLTRELLEEQGAYADSVAFLSETGPRIVQRMRDIRLDRVAADTFQLVVGTIDFARTDGTVQEYELRRLLVTLGRDQRIDANMPNEVEGLRNAVNTVLQNKANIESKLAQLAITPVAAGAASLRAAAGDLYRNTLSNVDRARTMLSIYAVLLLAAASFIAFRLHQSYRELNAANEELESLNEGLEQRVVARTYELENALQELKESQVQLVQAEKMSSLGQLVAGISHEINTPLLYLANNAVLIQERLELMKEFVERCIASFSMKTEDFPDRGEYQNRFVASLKALKLMLRDEEIQGSLEEAQDLVRDSVEGLNELTEMAQSLKDFSRLDRAPVTRFDVNAGLDKTLLIAKNIVKHKANVRKFYGEVPSIECSPSQINQVFLNIITNAAQAIDKEGEIVITTKRYDEGNVAVTIADTGCGIPEEHLGRIRDPFFTTKEVGTGTGLGLSIVDEIVRSHGGRLMVDSKVGKGSAFTVILPIKHTAAQRAAAPEQTPGAESSEDADVQRLAEAV